MYWASFAMKSCYMHAMSKPRRLIVFLILSYGLMLLLLQLTAWIIPKGNDVLLINGNHTPFLDWFFAWFTFLGDGIWFAFTILLLIFVRFGHAIMTAIISVLLSVVSYVFKYALFPGAGRPKTFIENELLHFVPNINVHAWHSFPSGHTATAFALATLISLLANDRRISVGLLLMALLVGYSRIYLLQHFLLDVAMGALMGTLITLVVYTVGNYLDGPSWTRQCIRLNITGKRRQSVVE